MPLQVRLRIWSKSSREKCRSSGQGVATDALKTKNHQYKVQKKEKLASMRSHSQTRLIDVLSLPQNLIPRCVNRTIFCKSFIFHACACSSSARLLSSSTTMSVANPIDFPSLSKQSRSLQIFNFCTCGYVFQHTSLLPCASCHLQSSGASGTG